jgi:hypothetical protein
MLEQIMSIPTPWGLIGKIIKWAWEKLTRFWLYNTYKKSHEDKQKLLRLGSYWESLGDHLEYSLRLSNPAVHEKIKSKLAFRCLHVPLKKVVLFFEARGSGLRYQQKIELKNVDENILIVTLDQIPQDDLLESSERGIFFTINEIQFIDCQLTMMDGKKLPDFDSLTSHLTYNWLLNDKWQRRWGRLWNCNSIEYAELEMSGYFRRRLGDYQYFILNSDHDFEITLMGRVRRLLCKAIIHPHVLTALFWLAIHSRRYSLGDGKLKRKK